MNYHETKEYIRPNCWTADIRNIYITCNSALCIKGWEFDNIGKRAPYHYLIIIACTVVRFDLQRLPFSVLCMVIARGFFFLVRRLRQKGATMYREFNRFQTNVKRYIFKSLLICSVLRAPIIQLFMCREPMKCQMLVRTICYLYGFLLLLKWQAQ